MPSSQSCPYGTKPYLNIVECLLEPSSSSFLGHPTASFFPSHYLPCKLPSHRSHRPCCAVLSPSPLDLPFSFFFFFFATLLLVSLSLLLLLFSVRLFCWIIRIPRSAYSIVCSAMLNPGLDRYDDCPPTVATSTTTLQRLFDVTNEARSARSVWFHVKQQSNNKHSMSER